MRKLHREPTAAKRPARAAVVVPNGTLFGDGVCARIKEELLKEFNLHTIVRLPNGVFSRIRASQRTFCSSTAPARRTTCGTTSIRYRTVERTTRRPLQSSLGTLLNVGHGGESARTPTEHGRSQLRNYLPPAAILTEGTRQGRTLSISRRMNSYRRFFRKSNGYSSSCRLFAAYSRNTAREHHVAASSLWYVPQAKSSTLYAQRD